MTNYKIRSLGFLFCAAVAAPTYSQDTVAPAAPSSFRDSAATNSEYFPPEAVWTQDVTSAPLSPQSAAIISWLNSAGGWGTGTMRIDFSIDVLQGDASTPLRTFTPNAEFYTPDCDFAPMPVPLGGAIEGEPGYQCTQDGDCHLIVKYSPTNKLYEMYRANIVGSVFYGGCLVVWDLNRVYSDIGRGVGCTSADASGFPIAPLLFSADEVSQGEIRHAIRFILPNARIRNRAFVAPATHATGAASGGVNAPAYGAHLRLRADFPLSSLPNDGARVVARAMQKYGIFLSDGGTIALTAQGDRFTNAKWDNLLGPSDLAQLRVTDFDVIDHGAVQSWNGDCVREP